MINLVKKGKHELFPSHVLHCLGATPTDVLFEKYAFITQELKKYSYFHRAVIGVKRVGVDGYLNSFEPFVDDWIGKQQILAGLWVMDN